MILLRGWLHRTLTQSASKREKLIAQQENLLVPDFRTRLLSSPARPNFRPRGPFLESPSNFSGAKSNIQIEI